MITNKELNEVNLSPTKKDYYQIWNELMELADKISERWSPASTNESDPGIVLLKALTAVADKLNYNIDKNTLEAFMPSATQEDSMRKLTEMMGYNMKYYQSATCKVNIAYKSTNEKSIDTFGSGIFFPKFTNLKNEEEDINYITLEDFRLQKGYDSREVKVMEGELLECESDNDNIISMIHLDDLNRYILPETAIAENGIFITNISDAAESDLWNKVYNLNTQLPKSKVYKFGFDSEVKAPYVQFPEDIGNIMGDGLRIKYIRTNGLNGNISAKILCKLEKPALWSTADSENIKSLAATNFAVSNNSAASNGADPESLTAAYNNYKKTVGTFDTLVTCRDYMNKIYQMTESDTNTTPLVSNIIVSDIRDDINRATPLCSFNEYGICYTDVPLKETVNLPNVTIKDANGVEHMGTATATKNKIEHFDLILYPFKTIYGLNNETEFNNSFKYSAENMYKIQADLKNNKTFAHNISAAIDPRNDIACIKNYLRLKAKVTTTKKVTYLEETEILKNIYTALYKNFNARQLDFGEEIPYESLLAVIKNADYRIKDINLDDPVLYTKFCLADNNELELVSTEHSSASTVDADKLYNKLALRNILAGKIAAFQYNENFKSEYDKAKYPKYSEQAEDGSVQEKEYLSEYPETDKKIKSLESEFNLKEALDPANAELKLKDNQVIQFRVPNFKTIYTYPAYVNYFIKLNVENTTGQPIPATFKTLGKFMEDDNRWESFINNTMAKNKMEELAIENINKFKDELKSKIVIFYKDNDSYKLANEAYYEAHTTDAYYYLEVGDAIFTVFNNWIKNLSINGITLNGIYRSIGLQSNGTYGKLVDSDLFKYMNAYKFGNIINNKDALEHFYVQATHATNDDLVTSKNATTDGLGQDSNFKRIPKDSEYKLKDTEYLLINYTDSKTNDAGQETKTVINKYWGPGTIIKPNFAITDSTLYHTNHSYSKRDGFYFQENRELEGMFTLGTNEQIEIRDVVKVELKESISYLYWELNSDDPNIESNEFKFTENYGNGTNNAYTLKEGEHLYYTNSKKQDLVYYGAGTIIVKHSGTPDLYKYAIDGKVSEEEIMTNGLAANIPWKLCDLSGDRYIEIIENQYISLTAGDTIKMIDNTENKSGIIDLNNNWINIIGAKYRFAEDDFDTELPVIAIDNNIKWEARSRLDFNMNRDQAQILNEGDHITIKYTDNTTVDLSSKKVEGKLVPLCINSNYACQAAVDSVDVSKVDFKLKISRQATPQVTGSTSLNLNNYINGDTLYTKFDFENIAPKEGEETTDRNAFSLNVNIPNDSFGLMMLYYIPAENASVGAYHAKIKSNVADSIKAFNKDADYTQEKTLTPGINIIELKEGANISQLDIYADTDYKSTIIFSNIDLITGINPKLDYRITERGTHNTTLKQLLADINALGIADDFYYNNPIQGANDIDLNPYVDSDLLSSPLTWYDPNNVNRKFVISQIDTDYLPTGITLTKNSRV